VASITLILFLRASVIFGQQDDPSDIFLKAYLSAQQGEKLEHQDRFKTALAKYRFAGSLIEELRKSHADWQPAVVEYRGRRISEAILRLQERITRQSQLNASASPLPEIAPVAPESDAWSEPGPEVLARPSDQALTDTQHDAGLKDSTKNLREKIAELQVALDKARGDLDDARKEKHVVDARLNDIQAKFAEANNHVIALEQERDDALLQLRSAKQTEQRFQSLLAEKSDLQQKLATAEEKVRKLSESEPGTTAKLAEMGQQLAHLQQQVTETQNRNYYLAARAGELDVELEHATTELQTAKLAEVNSEESAQLARENELLRNIVVRERQEEARREQARELILAELDRLKIRSDLLNKQIEFLAQPITRLSNEELALFRQPVVSISNEKPGVFNASFVFEKKSPAGAVDREKTNPTATTAPKAAAPSKLQEAARAAMNSVEQGNYRTAERQYQQILATDPNNLGALSNLGVVYFRTGKIRAAESTLKKALAIAPNDDFVLTTLGIVHYQQSRFDDALMELRRAIDINPNSATAHNYLGITASQKGRQQEAEKEILQAIAKNPSYADAHFNLAVVLITAQPSSKELAREHYARATALGTQPSPPLEKLLQ
jgi:tetratricopeptide (TPR) repeat protein